MKKFIKIFLLSFLTIIALLISLPFLFKDKIIAEAKKQMNERLNAKVSFEEIDLGLLSTFPNLNLSIEKLIVKNGKDFDSTELLNIESFQVNLDIMSVIKGEQFVINKIILTEPKIHAIINKEGKANWDIVKNTDTTKKTATPIDTSKSKFSLALRKFEISKANLIYDDQKGNSYYETKNLNYHLVGDLNNEKTILTNDLVIDEVSAKFTGIKYLSKAKVVVHAALEADMENQKFLLTKNSFQINQLELKLDGWVQMLKNAIDIDLKFEMPQISFKNILSLVPSIYSNQFKDIQAAGLVKFDGWLKGKKDSLHVPAFAFNLQVDKANFKYPSLPKSVDDINLFLKVNNPNGILDNTLIDLQKFHVAMAGNIVDATVKITTPIKDPNLDLTLNGKLDLSTVKDFVPLPDNSKLEGVLESYLLLNGSKSMVDKKQYDKFHAEGTLAIQKVVYNTALLKDAINIQNIAFSFSPKKVTLSDFDAKIGASDFKASGTIANFLEYVFKKDSNLVGTFNFSSNFLNINQFMSGDTSTKKTETKSEKMSVVEVPKNIDFELNTHIKKIVYDKMNIENVAGKVQLKNQKIMMQHLAMDMLNGHMDLNGSYNTQNKHKPSVDFGMNIQQFDIQKTAQTFNTIAKINPYINECFGAISCNLTLQTLLTDSMTPILNSIYAVGKLKTNNLKLQGENTDKLANLLKNNSLKEIKINDFEAKFKMQDGKLNIDTCEFEIQQVKNKFVGMYSLDQTMDAKMISNIPFDFIKNQLMTPEIEGFIQQAKNYDIPINLPQFIPAIISIKGKSTKPEYGFSLDKSFVANIQNDIKKGIENKLNKEKDRLINEGKKRLEEEKQKLLKEGQKKLEEEKQKLLEKGKDELKKWIPKF